MGEVLCKLFCVNNKQFLYDTNRNSLLMLSNEAYSDINKYINNNKYESKYITALLKKGYLKEDIIKEIKHPLTEVAEIIVERHLKSVILQVTKECNFRCRYCSYAFNSDYTRTHEKVCMSSETARKSIDYLFRHSIDSNEVNISFYGGEPLLNFELIKEIVLYSKEIMRDKKLSFSMTTNFYSVTEEMLLFLYKNGFLLSISLDGPPEYQNKHRKLAGDGSETYSKVFMNIKRLKELYPSYFDEHVQFNTVTYKDESNNAVFEYFEKKLNVTKEKVQLQRVDESGLCLDYDILSKRENQDNNEYFVSKNEKQYDKILSNKSTLPSIYWVNGSCVPGADKLFVSTNGMLYPCEKVNELNKCMCIGDINNGIDCERVRYLMNVGNLLNYNCRECWAIRFCRICCANCDSGENTLSKDMKEFKCLQIKSDVLDFLKRKVISK